MLVILAAVPLAVVYLPPLSGLLKLSPFPVTAWGAVVSVAAFTTLWAEPFKRPPR